MQAYEAFSWLSGTTLKPGQAGQGEGEGEGGKDINAVVVRVNSKHVILQPTSEEHANEFECNKEQLNLQYAPWRGE